MKSINHLKINLKSRLLFSSLVLFGLGCQAKSFSRSTYILLKGQLIKWGYITLRRDTMPCPNWNLESHIGHPSWSSFRSMINVTDKFFFFNFFLFNLELILSFVWNCSWFQDFWISLLSLGIDNSTQSHTITRGWAIQSTCNYARLSQFVKCGKYQLITQSVNLCQTL